MFKRRMYLYFLIVIIVICHWLSHFFSKMETRLHFFYYLCKQVSARSLRGGAGMTFVEQLIASAIYSENLETSEIS